MNTPRPAGNTIDSAASTSPPQARTFGLTLGVVAIGVEALVISPVLDDLGATFGVDVAHAGWAVSIYALTLAVVAPTVASIGHRVPKKTTMTAALVVFVIASLLCAWAPLFWILLAARAICGAAAGAFLPACYAYVGDTTPYAQRGRVMGRVMAGWSLALIVGVPLGSWIAQLWGWRTTFVVVGAAGCVAAWTISRLSAAGPVQGASVARSVLANGVPTLLSINFFNVLSFYAVYTFLGVTVRDRLGLDSGPFGLLVLCYGMGLLGSTLNAWVLDRYGKERLLRIALTLLAVMFAVLAAATRSPIALGACMLVWGVLQGFAQTAVATLVTEASGAARGVAMAWMSCASYMAVALGAAGGGWLLTHYGFEVLAWSSAVSLILALGLLIFYSAGQRRTRR